MGKENAEYRLCEICGKKEIFTNIGYKLVKADNGYIFRPVEVNRARKNKNMFSRDDKTCDECFLKRIERAMAKLGAKLGVSKIERVV